MHRCFISSGTFAGLAMVLAMALGGCPSFAPRPAKLAGSKSKELIDNSRLFVREFMPPAGKKPERTILLVHGFSASGNTWVMLWPALRQRHRVIVVDLPGFGRSDKFEGDYDVEAMARKLLTLLQRRVFAKGGAQQVDVVAHSWGTAISLAMAIKSPRRVRSLTLISSFAFPQQLPPFLLWARVPVLGEFLFGWLWSARIDDRMNYSVYEPQKHVHPRHVKLVKESMAQPGALAAALAAARGIRLERLVPHYGKLKQPVLLIAGREDRVTRLPAAQRLSNALPNARLVVLPQCGHSALVEHPQKVLLALRRFYANVPTDTVTAAPAASLPHGESREGAH